MKFLFLTVFFAISSIKINAHEISFTEGSKIIKSLLSELGQTTTSFRSEEKTVLKKSLFKKSLFKFYNTLQRQKTKNSQRDVTIKDGKNATFTFYGKRIYFYNLE